ncbi:hypothetical protein AB0J20_16225 [Micromonospora costi]|uniref:hypothetical protein n=1 Tax=Micromonospora costi TaxID=1530042 RepID=UPI003405FAC0
MLVNLTPHPIRIYGWQVPDRFNLGDHEPEMVIEPSGTVARLGQIELGTQHLRHCETAVEYVQYGHTNGLPPSPSGEHPTTWYVVSLPLALAHPRADLLVPYQEIRNLEGTVIGCRSLARPV